MNGLKSAMTAGWLAAGLMFYSCAPTEPVQEDPAQMLTMQEKRAVSEEGMVAAAHPMAADAGVKMLRNGGNAYDAAVATAFALAVVEPMMSGLGGSGAITAWDNENKEPAYIDFYAQLGENPDFELDRDQDENPDAVTQERIVAVPGFVKGLLDVLDQKGNLDRETVLQPAVDLARDGFPVHGLLGEIIRDYEDRLTYDEEAAAIFYPDGDPLETGDLLIQEDLADLLEAIAYEGASVFYESEFTDEVVKHLQNGGSTLNAEDFAGYEVRWRGALCSSWNGYTVMSAPPPLAGVEVALGLNMLEQYDLAGKGLPFKSGEAATVLAEVLRIARTDRGRWTGDNLFFELPTAGLISSSYAEHRSEIIGEVPDVLEPGDPWPFAGDYEPICEGEGWYDVMAEPEREWTIPEEFLPSGETSNPDEEEQHTTHLSVMDAEGNTVSMTNTMGLYFGSGVFKNGVFFNTTNRNVSDRQPNIRVAHRTAHSSTAPTIVLEDQEPVLAVGSPGSGRIPPAIISMTLYTLEYGLDPAVAIGLPRMYPFSNSPVLQTEGGFTYQALKELREFGYDLRPNPSDDRYFGGVHMILRDPGNGLIGAGDPRRDGVVKPTDD